MEVAEIDKSRYCAMTSFTRIYTFGPGYIDHPTVKTWTLRCNGNMLIESAAIEFSSFGSEMSSSNTQNDDPASHEERVNLSPGPEAARSSSKAVNKSEGELDRLEVVPSYMFRALDCAGIPTASNREDKSLESISYSGAKHAVCVGEIADNDHLHRAGIILGGQYARDSKNYVRIGYYYGKIPLQAKQARAVPSQEVDWLIL